MPAVATRSFAHSRRVRWPLRGGGQARYGSLPQFESERPARTTTQSAFMPRPNVVAAMGSRRLMPLLDPKTQCKQSGPESENETCPGPTVAHSPRTPSKLSMTAARVERSLHTALSRRRTTRPALSSHGAFETAHDAPGARQPGRRTTRTGLNTRGRLTPRAQQGRA